MEEQPIIKTTEVATQPQTPGEKLKQLLSSRKFWAALIGLALIIVKQYRPDFPLAEDQLTGIIAVLVAYILGVAVEDAGHAIGAGNG